MNQPVTYTLETWVSYPARSVNADDGLRIEFSIPVHSDLLPLMKRPDKRDILCKYRVKRGFLWGQLGRGATVRVEADLVEGARGGQHLHCTHVEILSGKSRQEKASPEQIRDAKRQERRMAKEAGVSLKDFREALKPDKTGKKQRKTRTTSPPTSSTPSPQLTLLF